MTVCDFYALTEQGFVYAGRTVGYDFDDAAEGDGAWPLDLTGDGRSELITRSTFGDGMSCVFVYRWNAAEGGAQRSEVDWDKADAQLARLSAPLGVTARAETYHAQDNTVTLTLYTESGTKETTLPLTTDILGEWFAEDSPERYKKEPIQKNRFLFYWKIYLASTFLSLAKRGRESSFGSLGSPWMRGRT